MKKYPSLIVLMLYGVACMSIGAALVYFGEQYDKSFSSPSSEVGVGTLPASTLYDPNSNVYVERKQK